MDLAEFLRQFPEVRLVRSEAEDERVREFFNSAPMKGEGLGLLYRRRPHFRSLLDAHSERHFVFYVGDDGTVEGAGTLVLRPALQHGKKIDVGYLGDLRVENIRRWGKLWRNFYSGLLTQLQQIDEFAQVRYLLTALMKQNEMAHAALARSPLGYHLLRRYRMVNLLRRWGPVPNTFQVRRWAELAHSELKTFYQRNQTQTPLAWVVDDEHDELRHRLQNWPGVRPEDALVLSDSSGVVASCLLWDPSAVKAMVVRNYPKKLRWAYLFLAAIKVLPRENEELRLLYVTSLVLREGLSPGLRQKAMRQIARIASARARQRRMHGATLAEFEGNEYDLRPFITQKTDLELYLVDPRRNPVPDFSGQIPAFEMGLV